MENSIFAAFVSDINIKPRDRTQVVFWWIFVSFKVAKRGKYMIIRKRNGKYYYDIGLENSKYKKKKKVTLIGITSIIVIVISLVLAGYTIYKNLNSKEAEQKTNRNIINDSQISATISDKWNYSLLFEL